MYRTGLRQTLGQANQTGINQMIFRLEKNILNQAENFKLTVKMMVGIEQKDLFILVGIAFYQRMLCPSLSQPRIDINHWSITVPGRFIKNENIPLTLEPFHGP